jgi:hypothetical protein
VAFSPPRLSQLQTSVVLLTILVFAAQTLRVAAHVPRKCDDRVPIRWCLSACGSSTVRTYTTIFSSHTFSNASLSSSDCACSVGTMDGSFKVGTAEESTRVSGA